LWQSDDRYWLIERIHSSQPRLIVNEIERADFYSPHLPTNSLSKIAIIAVKAKFGANSFAQVAV
jgi:hypothetical protein